MNESEQNKSSQQYISQEITDEFLQKYMPIEQFSAMKNIPEQIVLEMIREGSCVGYTKNNQWFVGRNEIDGFKGSISLANPQQKAANANSAQNPSSNGLLRLLRGEIDLAITFWIFGVLGSIAFFFLILTFLLINEDTIMFFFSIWVLYQFLITISVIRSCKHHKSTTAWPTLAIIMSLGFSALLAFIWLVLFSLFVNGYASN